MTHTQTKATHTPTPWRIGDAGRTVFGPPNGNPSPETVAHTTRADAAFIVRAVNSHAAFMSLAQHILAMTDDTYLVGHPEWNEIVIQAHAAIAQAENGANAMTRTIKNATHTPRKDKSLYPHLTDAQVEEIGALKFLLGWEKKANNRLVAALRSLVGRLDIPPTQREAFLKDHVDVIQLAVDNARALLAELEG